MITLVSGGAGSGKSEYAEALALEAPAAVRYYLATMRVWGEEDRQRIARHRAMRRGKGFVTIERPEALEELALPAVGTVLLEDLSNLTANECFGERGFAGAEECILDGICRVDCQAEQLIIVTNELFSDGIGYPAETSRYLAVLARLNRQLAARSGRVIEVVAGCPVIWKGKTP